MGERHVARRRAAPPEWVKHYGGPDPFIRIVEEPRLCPRGCCLHVKRTVTPRPYVQQFNVTIRFAPGFAPPTEASEVTPR